MVYFYTRQLELTMNLRHLDPLVSTFIDNNLPIAIGYQCYSVFFLAESLGLSNYDDTFVSLVTITDDVEPDAIRDVFVEKVHRLAAECVTQQQITLDPDANPSLDELKEIVHFLVLVQNLEDPEVVNTRLYGMGTPRQMFIDVLCKLSHMEPWRAMEIIEDVSPNLIEVMKQLLKDKAQEIAELPEAGYPLAVQALKEFMGDSECLGLKMFEAGFKQLQWDILTRLIPMDLEKHFEELVKTSVAQTAMDFVSLALVCKDTYQTPSLHLQKIMPKYLPDTDTVTRVYNTVMAILVDYQTTKDVMIQKQKLQEQSS